MGISEDIRQKSFKSEVAKSIINIFYTNSWLLQRHSELFKTRGLTMPQFNVLRILRGQHPDPCTVNLIIERMMDKSSNASRIIDKLEVKGLVIRRQCELDRRAVDVVISDLGLAMLKGMDVELDRLQCEMHGLTEGEATLLNGLLDKFRSEAL